MMAVCIVTDFWPAVMEDAEEGAMVKLVPLRDSL